MSEVTAGIIVLGIRHIMTILVGTASVYLGYRLFVEMPRRREGETKLDLPGGVSIMLSRVGPGTFFALFGAAMIVYAITKPLEVKDIAESVQTADGGNTTTRNRSLTGLGDAAAASPAPSPAVPSTALSIPRADIIAQLNAIGAEAKRAVSGPKLLDIQIAVRESKLALMREVWRPEWGAYEPFHRWVTERFAEGDPPAGLEEAAALFSKGR